MSNKMKTAMLNNKVSSKLAEHTEPYYKSEKQTLLSRYQIPIQNIDFDYIEKCQNGRELERILKILKSGEEGYYPELLELTEKRLMLIKPNSKLLRKICPVLKKYELGKDDQECMSNDLVDWVDDITEKDRELQTNKCTRVYVDSDVRKMKEVLTESVTKVSTKRITSTDYASWDKYDPDTEILKMDLEEEKIKSKATKTQKKNIDKPKSVTFNNFTTDAESIFEATREKEKGNDCFRAKEYQFALQHYTNSLKYKKSAVVFTNRAVTYNKLANYNLAISDCKTALDMEPQNFKAFLRMAQAYDQLKQYDNAFKNIEQAIKMDPNSTIAQELANRLQKLMGREIVSKRFEIKDATVDDSKDKTIVKPILKNYEVISIPGSSKMGPPYTKTIHSNDPKVIHREYLKANAPNLLHITTIDTDSEEDLYINGSNERESITKKIIEITQEHTGLEACKISEKNILNPGHKAISALSKVITQKQESLPPDSKAGGDCQDINKQHSVPTLQELQSPFSFMKYWNSAKNDHDFIKRAYILKQLQFPQIHEVIGNKMDDTMLSNIIECLHRHFAVAGEVDTVFSALMHLPQIPRFRTILLFLNEGDWMRINNLLNFLNQHGFCLPDNIKALYNHNK